MEIQTLKLFVTDADVVALVRSLAGASEAVTDLAVHLTPEGVQLSGTYPTGFLQMPFETLWQVSAAGPVVHVRLASVKVAGLPAGILSGALMKMVRDAVENQPGIRVQDELLLIDVPTVARGNGVDLAVQFTRVQMSIGSAVIEAG